MKVYTETYGCTSNRKRYEIIISKLEMAGILVKNYNDSDTFLINTCIVKGPTESRMLNRIRKAIDDGKFIIVTGCGSDYMHFRNIVKRMNRNIIFLSSHMPEYILKAINNWRSILEKKSELRICNTLSNKITGIVEIAKGCLSSCSFCATKIARGTLISKKPEYILVEVSNLLSSGCKEIYLTSQDNACYGFDINYSLPKLLNRILDMRYNFFLRNGMMNPMHLLKKSLLNKLINTYRRKKIYKFVHIPVQSGSNSILNSMYRPYTYEDFVEIVKRFRDIDEKITISTDIIVGFPGESKEDFNKSIELIKEVRVDVINVSKYYPRPETSAFNLEDNVSYIEKRRRCAKIFSVYNKISKERNKDMVGMCVKCLVVGCGKEKNQFKCRSEYYKDIVVYDKVEIGEFVNVLITDYSNTCLFGEIIL